MHPEDESFESTAKPVAQAMSDALLRMSDEVELLLSERFPGCVRRLPREGDRTRSTERTVDDVECAGPD